MYSFNLLLQGTQTDRIVDTISEYDPLLGIIVLLLIIAVTSMSTVVVFLFRMYTKESSRKDKQIEDLNEFIRTSYQENTAILNDMVRVIDILTRTTEEIGEDVRGELQSFVAEMRTHISVLQNIPSMFLSKRKEDEQRAA